MHESIHVYLPEGYADWEVGHALAHLHAHDAQFLPTRFEVTSVGESLAPVRSMGGLSIVPSQTLSDVVPTASAMLILPGATSWDRGGNEAALDKAREFIGAGVPVAAICGATAGLARAGLLDTRRHTSNAPEYLKATGYRGTEQYVDAPVVVDAGVLTASSLAPLEFARAVFEMLEAYPAEVIDAWYALFSDPAPGRFEALQRSLGPQ